MTWRLAMSEDSLGHEARFPLTPDEERELEDRYHDFPPEDTWGVIIGVSKCTKCGAERGSRTSRAKENANE